MNSMAAQRNLLRRARQRGNEVIEFTLCLFPILGFLFMTIDVAWMVFTRATLQNAVQQGMRFAVVSRGNYASPTAHKTAIKDSVKWWSRNMLRDKDDLIKVEWYSPDDLSTPLPLVNSDGSPSSANAAGNVVKVSVENFIAAPLLGIFHDLTPWAFRARSSDRMW